MSLSDEKTGGYEWEEGSVFLVEIVSSE